MDGQRLFVSVTFKPGSKSESGRIWWMFDRGPDGSAAYIDELFPRNQWKDMTFDTRTHTWNASIPLMRGATRIDFFSNHLKTITYRSVDYASYRSSPYSRVPLRKQLTD